MERPAVKFTMQIVDERGEVVGHFKLNVWPDDLMASEYKAKILGRNLFVDAIRRIGMFPAFLDARERERKAA
jgi:hypothetical protein